jgi:hypothetical protein
MAVAMAVAMAEIAVETDMVKAAVVDSRVDRIAEEMDLTTTVAIATNVVDSNRVQTSHRHPEKVA